MKKLLLLFISVTSVSAYNNKCFGQTEAYYTDPKCKLIYFEVTSSKLKIFYGNGMDEEILGKSELLVASVSNLFLKNGYDLNSVLSKPINGESRPGYLFFVRKE